MGIAVGSTNLNPETAMVLQDILPWPCRAAKLFGHWPFAYSKGQLQFHWISWGSFFTAINLCVEIGSLMIVRSRRQNSSQRLRNATYSNIIMSPTEAFGHTILIFVQSLAVIFLLLVTIALRNKILALHSSFEHALSNVSKCAPVATHTEMLKAKLKVRNILVTFVGLAVVRACVFTAVLGSGLKGVDQARACFTIIVCFIWILTMAMVTSWLAVVYGLVLILGNAFEILAKELEGKQSGYAQPMKTVENVLDRAKQLRQVLKEMNETLKVPLVGLFVFMIIALTVSIFFAAVGVSKHSQQLVIFCTLNLAIFMFPIHVLSSGGEELVSKGRRYADALERVECHTDELRFKVRNSFDDILEFWGTAARDRGFFDTG